MDAAGILMVVRKDKVLHLLTEDLLFDPRSGIPYPHSPTDYQAILARILDAKGRFPGDTEALTPSGTYARPSFEGTRLAIARGPFVLQGEVLSPALDAPRVKNRLVFDTDLVTQTASFDSYGTPGVSYDRDSYYVERLYKADKVVLIRLAHWPIAFAAVSEFQAPFGDRMLVYFAGVFSLDNWPHRM